MLISSNLAHSTRRLRLWLALFFALLVIPTALLVYKAYDQLKWQSIHQYRGLAEELTGSISRSLADLVGKEEARSFTEYTFLNLADTNVGGATSQNFLQRSPLAALPAISNIAGVIGYFQVDSSGLMSSPLLPATSLDSTSPAVYGINEAQWQERTTLVNRVREVLAASQLVQARDNDLDKATVQPATAVFADEKDLRTPLASSAPIADSAGNDISSQIGFDRLSEVRRRQSSRSSRKLGDIAQKSAPPRVDELKLEKTIDLEAKQRFQVEEATDQSTVRAKTAAKQRRRETNSLPEGIAASAPQRAEVAIASDEGAAEDVRVLTFESEIDPFELGRLNDEHFVLYRKVWRDGQRYIQGLLIDTQVFLQATIKVPFTSSALSDMSSLIVAHQGDVLDIASAASRRDYVSTARDLEGSVLYQSPLGTPFDDVQLLFNVVELPHGPGASLINWLAGVLSLLLCGGFYLMYRLGFKQIEVSHQQQDFVAAVSHELKTPLTSIRMYGEMLREGWAPDEKKTEYYNYIHDESERLSRLINNVLQLARLNRNEFDVSVETLSVDQLVDIVRSKVASQVERAGFELVIDCTDSSQPDRVKVSVDPDLFTQVMINLIDNAIKFSAKAELKRIEINAHAQGSHSVRIGVRDYGPGIDQDQMKKIFRLFYRSENELTRETVGTGIGLALVQQLVVAMNGEIDVINKDVGSEFMITLPQVSGSVS